MENTTAKVLKVLAVILGIIGLISAIFTGAILGNALKELFFPIALYVFLSCEISALFLYAFGEIISLLEDIYTNTYKQEY